MPQEESKHAIDVVQRDGNAFVIGEGVRLQHQERLELSRVGEADPAFDLKDVTAH